MKKTTYKKLTAVQRELVDKTFEALGRAYQPYSHFSVGAALRATDGTIITGANVENAAYGPSICAERSALVRANAMGYRQFSSLAVVGKSDKRLSEEVTAPCGTCRQMIYEASQLSGHDIEIILVASDRSTAVVTSIEELLPMAFGPKDLGIELKRYKN